MRQGTLGGLSWAASGRPCLGETVSGDMALVKTVDDSLLVAIFDGMGHGPGAHEVALAARGVLIERANTPLLDLFDIVDEALRGSLGGALGLGTFEPKHMRVRFAGVGNTVARRVYPSGRRFVCSAGVMGQRYRRPTVHNARLAPGDVWLFHTDGVSSAFGATQYPQISYQSSGAVARTVVRRFSNDFDDATSIAVRVVE